MDDNTRENLVGWGTEIVDYMLLRHGGEDGFNDMIWINSAIEEEHTRYVVAQRTGDARLARIAGARAGAREFLGMYVIGIATFVTFVATFALSMVAGEGAAGMALFWLVCIPATIAALVGSCWFMAGYSGRSWHARQQGNLPTVNELNRTGYWEVEPDVWHNPINGRTLQGRAYKRENYSGGGRRSGYQTESQQIRALYRQMKHNPPSRPTVSDPNHTAGGNIGRGLFDRTDGT